MRSDISRRDRRAGKKPKPSAARLDVLIAEVLVDAYGDSEERTAFYTVLEDSLALPFTTQVLGVEVLVERLALTADDQIVAVCRHGRTRQRIPLLELPLPNALPQGAEWIEAFRRWANARCRPRRSLPPFAAPG
jgi:Calcium binding